MVDYSRIDTKALADNLWKIEPDLVGQVHPDRMDACLAGACEALKQPDGKGRGR